METETDTTPTSGPNKVLLNITTSNALAGEYTILTESSIMELEELLTNAMKLGNTVHFKALKGYSTPKVPGALVVDFSKVQCFFVKEEN